MKAFDLHFKKLGFETKFNPSLRECPREIITKEYAEIGYAKGFNFVESGPLVRSSYHAERHI